MRQRVLIPLVVLLLFALGMLGQYQLSPLNLTERFSTSAYEVLMLFLLDGEWTLELERVPLAIEIVRFTAPLVAVASLVFIITENVRVAFRNFFARFARGHTVVMGLGRESLQFLQTCPDKGDYMVLERNPDNELIGRARALGIRVIVRDTGQPGAFDAVNLGWASNIVVFSTLDGENVEMALEVRDALRQLAGGEEQPRLHIHLNDMGLAHILEEFPRFSTGAQDLEVSFFSVYDLSARLLLRDYPAELFADIAGHDRVHMAIYGYGRLAEKVIMEAAMLFQFRNHSRLRITVYDEKATIRALEFASNHPRFELICDLDFVDVSSPGMYYHRPEDEAVLSSVTQHIICKGVDDENLEIALRLRHMLMDRRGCNAPIFVRMQRSVGLAQLVHTDKGAPEIPDGIYPFGMLDEVLQVDNVLSSRLDSLARGMHDMYMRENEMLGGDAEARGWNQLTQDERKQNRLKADHWPVRLRAIRCVSNDMACPLPELSPAEVEVQAVMEHNRYFAQKIIDGWQYGPEKSSIARTNPFVCDWDALPPAQQRLEVEDARAQPEYFAERIGHYVKRRLVIGVTGHRLNKMNPNDRALRAALVEALVEIRQANPGACYTVLSPLAEGADRLVATLAMEHLNARLQVPMPLPYELCLYDFSSDESADEFQTLVGKAEFCFEMPVRFGSKQELAASPDARARQYALSGAYIAQRCDYLLAIWDGEPEDGVGGTAQVVRWYSEGNVEENYAYPDGFFEPPARHPVRVFSPAGTVTGNS